MQPENGSMLMPVIVTPQPDFNSGNVFDLADTIDGITQAGAYALVAEDDGSGNLTGYKAYAASESGGTWTITDSSTSLDLAADAIDWTGMTPVIAQC